MDAKPQKPVRGFRVHGDENALPLHLGNKTLHSRNKSSPALSTMAVAGVNKAPIKRTAFGDVSNTTHSNRASRDDSALPTKAGAGDFKEQASAHLKSDLKASAPLLRPAQRPLSQTNSLRSTASSAQVVTGPSQKLVPECIQPSLKGNLRKSLSKKSTTVFRDYSTDPYPDDALNPTKLSMPAHPDPDRKPPFPLTDAGNKPVHSHIRKVKSTYSIIPSTQESKVEDARPCQAPALVRPISKPESQQSLPSVPAETSVLFEEECRGENDAQLVSLLSRVETSEACYVPPSDYYYATAAVPRLHATEVEQKASSITAREPEEYWDEDDEENYEEEGYVTARSFRSRSENVTVNATQTLVPRTNHKIRRELEVARKLVESMRTVEEVEDEAWDTSMVAEYGEEIFEYMHHLENKMQPNPHYMDLQTEIQWSMRSVLMDWLVQVHHRFQLLPETLFLCVNYIDRFLSYKVVSLGKLQLVGATAIFVAAKYEEINCPSVSEIVYMVDGGYSVDEILKAERFMLSMLQFELGWPGPMSFLRRISKADDYDLETRTLAKYFLEVTIMDERFLGCPPSFTAAGAHCLARLMLQKGAWTPHHVYYSGYTYSQLWPLLRLLYECCEDPAKHHAAIYDKYQDKRYKCASRFVANEARKGFQVPDTQQGFEQQMSYASNQMAFCDASAWSNEKAVHC